MSEHSGINQYGKKTAKTKAFIMICFCKTKFCYQADIENLDGTLFSVKQSEKTILKEDLIKWIENKKILAEINAFSENSILMGRNRKEKHFRISNFLSIEEIVNEIINIIYDNLQTIETIH